MRILRKLVYVCCSITLGLMALGTTDIQAVMEGTSGTSYAQYYLGINKVDMNDLNFALTIEGGHLVF